MEKEQEPTHKLTLELTCKAVLGCKIMSKTGMNKDCVKCSLVKIEIKN